ncbi:hypothetical protein CAPTEDRAFT_226007 [Capitella teleta]|uniref:B box-type domain-containing protein n=1 Tax=Capitella teleta TaxID=283909 RepID=R7VKR2_CAPTE|nr:hypothetical protein CAPTEDRAFT_226007 [Capitella teleta]|eukprot:ELU17596.1 hypothetical protein CAPTEDRAFT_226007 [Capitella teleta]
MAEHRTSHRQSSGCSSYSYGDAVITSDTNCLLCMDVVINPCVLHCQHVFCEPCLQLYLKLFDAFTEEEKEDAENGGIPQPKSSQGVCIQCPVCRKITKCEIISLLTRPSDVQENSRKVSQPGESSQECDVCAFKMKTVESDYYCSKCMLNMCTNCNNIHDQQNIFRSHTSVHISNKETITLYCETHNKLQMIYFCSDCYVPVCTVCVLQTHASHQNHKLFEALAMRRENLKTLLNSLWPKLNKLDIQVQKLLKLTSVSRRKNGVSLTSSPVATFFHSKSPEPQTKTPNGKSQSSPPILQSTVHAQEAEVPDHNRTQYMQFYLENLKRLFDKSMKLLEMSHSKKLMAPYNNYVGRLEVVIDFELKQLKAEVDEALRAEKEIFCSQQQQLQGSPKYPTKYGNESSYSLASLYDRPSSVASSVTDNSPIIDEYLFETPQQHSMLVQPKMLWKVEKQRNDAGELWNPCDVAFLDDGNMVVAEYDVLNDKNNKLRIFDPTGTSLDTLAKGIIRPLGVAITREGNIAVTDCKGKRVKIFSPNGQLISDIGKGQFGWPYGISTNTKGQIIVTDAFNDVIHIYQADGKRIKQFGSSGSNSNQFRNPYHVTNDHHDNIIVSDSGNNCFKVFNANGDFILKTCEEHRVTTGGEKLRRRGLKGPRGITTDLKGNILVADDRSRVAHYSNSGKYIRNLLAKDDSVKYPEALCCCSSGRLVVTEWNPNNMFAVKVFDLYE